MKIDVKEMLLSLDLRSPPFPFPAVINFKNNSGKFKLEIFPYVTVPVLKVFKGRHKTLFESQISIVFCKRSDIFDKELDICCIPIDKFNNR